jgi:hypothetical protein
MSDEIIKKCDLKVQKKPGTVKAKCGKPVPGNVPTPVTIGTTRYVMDLCQEHQEALNEALNPFLSVAHDTQRRTGTQVRKAIAGKKGAFTTADVRRWLREQGREVATDGRIAKELIAEYQDAHK